MTDVVSRRCTETGKEINMIEVSENAVQEFKNYFKEKDISAVRVYGQPGWGGYQLKLALDEPGDNDNVFEVEGLKFVIDSALLKEMGTINIDAGPRGFMVDAANLKQSTCPSAGGGCSCWSDSYNAVNTCTNLV